MDLAVKTLSIFMVLFLMNSAVAAPAAGNGSSRKTVTLITHEAAPWMAEKLTDQGAIFYALRKVLEKRNYELKVIFAPSWIRAKMDAVKNPAIDGYAPIRTIEHQDVFDFTEVIFESPWSVGERKDKPIPFHNLESLIPFTAGNVQGVELRPGIDALVKKGFKIEETSTQANNILKLATGRVDFIFVDKGVYRYMMATEPSLAPYRDKLQLNPKSIVIEKYKVGLKKAIAKELVPYLNSSRKELGHYLEEYFEKLETVPSFVNLATL
ncbi:substrate-binding periplasmic protein [Bdellovibrio sp. HCB209]|uniref:substrate-binding periplasmic protein n=1 Tax=Bdellovibrio sp. HCB209 TaxID=3394354 RepID=UPI0039B44A7D